MLDVIEVRYLHDYVLWLRFDDGVQGEVDLSGELDGEIFEPLRDRTMFATVAIHPDLGTIAWSNGADFAPEFLHSLVRVPA